MLVEEFQTFGWITNSSLPPEKGHSSGHLDVYFSLDMNFMEFSVGRENWWGQRESLSKNNYPLFSLAFPHTANLKGYLQPPFCLFHCLLTHILLNLNTVMTSCLDDPDRLFFIWITENLFYLLYAHTGRQQPLWGKLEKPGHREEWRADQSRLSRKM